MKVQPYFPDPIEVPGNVAAEAYDTRLTFVRKVVGIHLLTVALISTVASLLEPNLSLRVASLSLFASLLVLSAVRQLSHTPRIEQGLSALLLAPVIVLLGMCLRYLVVDGIPAWSLACYVSIAAIYTFACGRDLSFVGQFVISLGAGSLACIGLAWWLRLDWTTAATAVVIGGAYLFFYVYDLAALLQRRRQAEVLSAVADLYRDVLNFISYAFRVLAHWRSFRI